MRIIAMVGVVAFLGAFCRAEEPGISVTGFGTARARPSVVEISATISADAEQARDASVKQRDARQRIIDAMEKIKDASVAVESRGIAVNQVVDPAMQQLQARAAQQLIVQGGVLIQAPTVVEMARKFSVSEQVRLVVRDTDKLELTALRDTIMRLIDMARDNGLQLGQSVPMTTGMISSTVPTPTGPLIIYRIPDPSPLREQANQAAIEDARKKATRLAEMSGVKIGRIIAIREQDVAAGAEQGLMSSVLGELSMNVNLAVQFEILR
jgi:uncharacterized protein